MCRFAERSQVRIRSSKAVAAGLTSASKINHGRFTPRALPNPLPPETQQLWPLLQVVPPAGEVSFLPPTTASQPDPLRLLTNASFVVAKAKGSQGEPGVPLAVGADGDADQPVFLQMP